MRPFDPLRITPPKNLVFVTGRCEMLRGAAMTSMRLRALQYSLCAVKDSGLMRHRWRWEKANESRRLVRLDKGISTGLASLLPDAWATALECNFVFMSLDKGRA
jgi:hypothetical protein